MKLLGIEIHPYNEGFMWRLNLDDEPIAEAPYVNDTVKECIDSAREFLSLLNRTRGQQYVGIAEPPDEEEA